MQHEDVIALFGGLGNQLFQVAFARWLSGQTGRDIRYDVSFNRDVDLDVLEIPEIGAEVRDRLLSGTRRWPTPDGRIPIVGRALRKARGPRRIVSSYAGAGPVRPSADEAAWWFGYWQRLEYARALIGCLREALGIRCPVESDGVVGVHVRRADMLMTGASVPGSWFGVALRRLELELGSSQICVWSDDPAWCRNELDLGLPFDVAPNAPPVEHLGALARCRALVISRSTFSWWAAAIAESRGARVAFPTPWWHGSPELESAVVPSAWIAVK